MRKIIFKYLTLLMPVVCAIILLSSDAKTRSATDKVVESQYIIDLSDSKSDYLDGGWGNNIEGSAKYLSGRTGIITFFVGDNTSEWSKSDIQTVCEKLDIACEYLESYGKKYKQHVKLIRNLDGLMFQETADEPLSHWETSDYTRQVYNWIDRDINCESIMSKYDLDGLLFLVVLNKDGISYAIPHNVEDGRSNYYECVYIYLFDSEYPDRYESPAAYAHEMLHAFGAIDLYDNNANLSTSLEEFIASEHPNEIMYTTYLNGSLSVSDKIPLELSDITAYEIGFLSTCDELSIFPELEKEYPAAFSINDGVELEIK